MFTIHHYHHTCPQSPGELSAVLQSIAERIGIIMETQAQVAERIEALNTKHDTLTAQVNKVGGEISQNLADLRTAIENQGNASPAVLDALVRAEASANNLGAAVQTADDLNPDAPV